MTIRSLLDGERRDLTRAHALAGTGRLATVRISVAVEEAAGALGLPAGTVFRGNADVLVQEKGVSVSLRMVERPVVRSGGSRLRRRGRRSGSKAQAGERLQVDFRALSGKVRCAQSAH